MITLKRTDSSNPDFVELVALLDAELKIRDGEDNAFYAQYNGISDLKQVVVAYKDGHAVSCGAIKAYDEESMEVKRMYTREETRRQGIAHQVLAELEKWTSELGYKSCILETGLRNPEAIKLYESNNYKVIPNFGQYQGVANSCCFLKSVNS